MKSGAHSSRSSNLGNRWLTLIYAIINYVMLIECFGKRLVSIELPVKFLSVQFMGVCFLQTYISLELMIELLYIRIIIAFR